MASDRGQPPAPASTIAHLPPLDLSRSSRINRFILRNQWIEERSAAFGSTGTQSVRKSGRGDGPNQCCGPWAAEVQLCCRWMVTCVGTEIGVNSADASSCVGLRDG